MGAIRQAKEAIETCAKTPAPSLQQSSTGEILNIDNLDDFILELKKKAQLKQEQKVDQSKKFEDEIDKKNFDVIEEEPIAEEMVAETQELERPAVEEPSVPFDYESWNKEMNELFKAQDEQEKAQGKTLS